MVEVQAFRVGDFPVLFTPAKTFACYSIIMAAEIPMTLPFKEFG